MFICEYSYSKCKSYWGLLTEFSFKASSTAKYPVMIYIHGGGLTAGSGDMSVSAIVRNFVSKGIVVASLQYRMGWLGNNFFKSFKIYL